MENSSITTAASFIAPPSHRLSRKKTTSRNNRAAYLSQAQRHLEKAANLPPSALREHLLCRALRVLRRYETALQRGQA